MAPSFRRGTLASKSPSTLPPYPLAVLDPARLHVEIFFHLLEPGFTAVSAHLVAAERHCRGHRLGAVYPYGPGADSACQAMRLAHVPRPDAAAQPEHRGIGAMHQFIHVLQRYRRDDRTENLLLRNPHVVADIGEDRGRHEIALSQRPLRQSLAAGLGARSLLLAETEIARHALELLLRHQRANLGLGIEAIADAEALAESGDPIGKFVVDLLLDEQAGTGTADLAGMGQH